MGNVCLRKHKQGTQQRSSPRPFTVLRAGALEPHIRFARQLAHAPFIHHDLVKLVIDANRAGEGGDGCRVQPLDNTAFQAVAAQQSAAEPLEAQAAGIQNRSEDEMARLGYT